MQCKELALEHVKSLFHLLGCLVTCSAACILQDLTAQVNDSNDTKPVMTKSGLPLFVSGGNFISANMDPETYLS